MDKEQAAFEQLTLSNFKKWSSTALKAHSHIWQIFWNGKTFKNAEKCFSP